jgi:hypothetical protein
MGAELFDADGWTENVTLTDPFSDFANARKSVCSRQESNSQGCAECTKARLTSLGPKITSDDGAGHDSGA